VNIGRCDSLASAWTGCSASWDGPARASFRAVLLPERVGPLDVKTLRLPDHVAPSQREQLSDSQATEGRDDDQARVLLVLAAADLLFALPHAHSHELAVRSSPRGLGDGQDLRRGVGHDLRRMGLAPFLCPGHGVQRERERVRPATEGEHAVHDRPMSIDRPR
jgi:hypothetical protein